MNGWRPVPGISGGHDDVEQCAAATCGAYVRRSEDGRQRDHDREFHLLRAELGGPNGGYDLFLDGQPVGYIYEKVQRYNLIRTVTARNWQIVLKGVPSFDGGERFRDAMAEAVKASGAKAWGRGRNPQTWHYPEERR